MPAEPRQLDVAPSDAVLVASLDGRILRANSAACTAFGCGAEPLVGRPVTRLIVPGQEAFLALIAEYGRRRQSRGDLRFVREDGTTFAGHVSCASFFDYAGEERIGIVIRQGWADPESDEPTAGDDT